MLFSSFLITLNRFEFIVRAMAAKFASYFGIAMGTFSGLGLLIGCLATGRTKFNVCGGWKTRFTGRCCVIMVSVEFNEELMTSLSVPET